MTPPPIPPVTDASKRVSIRYSLTRGDILRWQFYQLIRNRLLMALYLGASLLLVWRDLRAPELAEHSLGFKLFYGVFFTGLYFTFYHLLTMLLLACIMMFKKYRGFLGEHELEIRDEGLVERTDVNETLNRWAGFHQLVSTSRYLYIYVTDQNVHVVPRHCFGSAQAEQVFRAELERHIKAAKS
jgi:hypothetical protein